jgi:sucrose phosphorylase
MEIHAHYRTQIRVAQEVGRVYDFALPPLVLHALYFADPEPLANWLRISPRDCVTVLDTHDGIGIVDAARDGESPGLLSDKQVTQLVATIHAKTGGESLLASGDAAANLDIYQINSTYFSALAGDEVDYLIARAIQFFAPGTPGVLRGYAGRPQRCRTGGTNRRWAGYQPPFL